MQSTNRPLLLPANHPNSKIPSVSQHFFKYIYYCKSTDYKFPFQKRGKIAGFLEWKLCIWLLFVSMVMTIPEICWVIPLSPWRW